MYRDFYGFTGNPFQSATDPACYFESVGHRRALSCLGDGLAQGEGHVVLTGEAGAGKTALVARVMATIDRDRMTTAQMVGCDPADGRPADDHLAQAHRESGPIIPVVACAFGLGAASIRGLGAETRHPLMLDALLCFLRDEARANRRCLLVVDEAQALPIAALEALRVLSLFQVGARPLLQILLVGRPEFLTRLQCHPDLEQLRQRVVASHHLDPLESGEVEPYIHHRLKSVGWNGNPGFTPRFLAACFAHTGGVPGRINQIIDRLLLLGAAQQQELIDETMLSQVLAESTGHASGGGEKYLLAAPVRKPRLEVALSRCERQIAELQQAVVELVETGGGHARSAHRHDNATLLERLGSLESSVIEQDRTIRHTLTMLIEWIERGEAHSVAA